NAYDTMRGAGVRVGGLSGFPEPEGVTRADLAQTWERLRALGTPGWKPDQTRQFEEALEGLDRILSADSDRDALAGIEDFDLNLNKCKRGNATYTLLKDLKEKLKNLEYSLITSMYAQERALLIDVLRRFDTLYRERKRAASV